MNELPTRFTRLWITRCLTGVLCALLAACAHRPPEPAENVTDLLHDDFYAQPLEPVDPQSVFAFSPEMRRFAEHELSTASKLRDPRAALLETLSKPEKLRLVYDASRTRNAAQAFEARAGNCLSLVIMTAAFARHLGVGVSFQSVPYEESYTRSGDLLFASMHVNLVLRVLTQRIIFTAPEPDDLTVDFLPAAELRGKRAELLQEQTVMAMYFNNRAAELLADGDSQAAYRHAREALHQDPRYQPAINTLAVIYMRGGHAQAAEAALRHVLARQPASTGALSNLVLLLQRSGRADEAAVVAAQLAKIQPEAPFQSYELGRRAMDRGEYARARELFARELQRQPYQSEVHFWAAMADARLGDSRGAAKHLQQAEENSVTLDARMLYAGKLARLRELHLQ